jgi:hypothetical protein
VTTGLLISVICFLVIALVGALVTRRSTAHDATRLDFLSASTSSVFHNPGRQQWGVMHNGRLVASGKTMREAIDASIRVFRAKTAAFVEREPVDPVLQPEGRERP